jgi:hypothetical protein
LHGGFLLDVLFERGWLEPGVRYLKPELEKMLQACEDFASETTAMKELMDLLGHEVFHFSY